MLRVLQALLLLSASSNGVFGAGPCPPTGSTGRFDYGEALCMAILFYEAERSGPLPSDMRFDWRGDSALGDGQDVGKDLTGGYFDAGDHVKFGFPMAYTVTTLSWGLLSYRSAYETTGQVQYAEAAIKWATDYFLKAHTGPNEFYGQVGDGNLDHAFWGRPEEMTMSRPAFVLNETAPGSDLIGETAAALAAASLVFADSDPGYAATCLTASQELFSFADNFRELYHVSIPNAADFYRSWSGYGDELTWAAIWLYKATQNQIYADRAMELWDEFGMDIVQNYYHWDVKTPGVQVLFAEQFGGDYYLNITRELMVATRAEPHTPGGLVYLDQWGSLRHALNAAFIGFKIADLGVDVAVNQVWGAQQVDYALGSFGRSFIVGFGVDPPLRPHHRASSCPAMPEPCDGSWALNQEGPNPLMLYGALVGGPDAFDGYVDDRTDYVQNEVGCDYNAGLASALAAMITLN